jgi:uncharacterized protein
MKRFFRGLFLAATFTYLALCAALFFGQRAIIYHPPALSNENTTRILSMPVDGAELKISIHDSDTAKALIYFGGNADNVPLILPYFEQAFPQQAIYIMHYRGYSGSTGEPSEAALHADAKKLYDLVHAKHSDITVVGRSLGSGIAVRLAATQKVDKLVLVTPFDSILNLAKAKFPFFPVDLLLEERYESNKYAAQVKAPTVIMAAEHDQVIPLENTKALLAIFKPGLATLKLMTNTNHDNIVEAPSYFDLMR